MTDRPSSALGNISDSEEVEAQVRAIVTEFAPGHDLARIGQTFSLLRQAFNGHLPGYVELKTRYHNPSHTISAISHYRYWHIF